MKNQKIILVFALIAVFLLVMTSLVSATDNNTIQINPPVGAGNNQVTNDQQSNQLNITGQNNTVTNNQVNNSTNNTLPQTGVVEDTTLFVFIAICVVSAVYAFIKIRNYKNV